MESMNAIDKEKLSRRSANIVKELNHDPDSPGYIICDGEETKIINSLEWYIKECAAITESKGFDVSKMPEQLLLIVTEIGEAFEHLDINFKGNLNNAIMLSNIREIVRLTRDVEDFRQEYDSNLDFEVSNKEEFAEELADIAIRLFSFCGGNDIDLISAIQEKMEKNRDREELHGKRF